MQDYSEIIKCFKPDVMVYTNEFTSANGDPVKITSICLVQHGQDFNKEFRRWGAYAGHKYTLIGTMSQATALELKPLDDRLSLRARLELVGEKVRFLSHEIALEYL